MVNNVSAISKEEKETRKGRDSGRTAAKYGYTRAVFQENDDLSIIYKNAYDKAYDKAAAVSSPEEKLRRQAEEAGKQRAWSGMPKKDFTGTQKTPEYIESYLKGYERITIISEKQQKLKERNNGLKAGEYAALKDKIKLELSDKASEDYNKGYKIGYEKFMALSSQEKLTRKGKLAGRIDASKNRPRPDFKGGDTSPIYQKAYLQAYDNYILKKSKTSSQADSGLSYRVSNVFHLRDVSGREESTPLQLPSETDGMKEYEEEFNSEFFYPQKSLSPSSSFPDFSMPGMGCSIVYSEKLNSPQELDTVINSVEELSEYLDSLTSPTPDARMLKPLLSQDKATSMDFDTVDDLLGVYETIQPKPLNQSRFFQPIFFSTRLQAQQPEPAHEASIDFRADRINKN